MDIAATGLALPLLAPVRDRPQARPDNSQSQTSRNDRGALAGDASNLSEGRNERVVPGEVIYVRPERARGADRAQPGFAEATPDFNTSTNRRFSLQAALQTFKDNEALVSPPGETRQVSGIIDEYV